MPHIVLGDAAVQIPIDTRLNGNAQSGGGAAADVAPSLPIVGAALPLVSYPVAAGCNCKGSDAAHGAAVVFRLGGDDHRRLLGQRGKLSSVLPAHSPAVAVIVAGRVANGIVGNGFSVIGGQNIVYGVIGRQGLGCRWNKYTTDLRYWQHPIIFLIFEKALESEDSRAHVAKTQFT